MSKFIKFLLVFSLLFGYQNNVFAGNRDWHIGISPSVYVNPFSRNVLYGLGINLEKEISHRNYWGISLLTYDVDISSSFFKDCEYNLLCYWKPMLSIGKNNYSTLKFGGNIGSSNKGITFGLNAGIEYNIVLRNRIKFFISQDNLLVFRGNETFLSSLSIGLKIPLN